MQYSLFSKLFHFVLMTSSKYNIDESHGLSHSMNVLHHAHNIYRSELPKNPFLMDEERAIYVSAIVHDMCDKKYMNEAEGIKRVENFLNEELPVDELYFVKQIISTMSYSTVKKYWFPYIPSPTQELAYHIVREADLLSACDFDRSMIFHMTRNKANLNNAFKDAETLFKTRVLNHERDGLLVTDYSKSLSRSLNKQAILRMNTWRRLLS